MKDHIYQLEMETLSPAVRKSAKRLNQLFSDEFIEFGSSGKIYNKQNLLESLPNEKEKEIQVEDFKVLILSEDVALATYKATIDNVVSLRSSTWKRKNSDWQMVFHQGTKCR